MVVILASLATVAKRCHIACSSSVHIPHNHSQQFDTLENFQVGTHCSEIINNRASCDKNLQKSDSEQVCPVGQEI
jgi:hypothetical protein